MDLFQDALSIFFNYLQMTPEQVLWTLSIPIVIDLPRSIGKAAVLLLHSLYIRLTSKEYGFKQYPLVSIIVPAHNEEECIERTITALLEQDYPNKEIIVVDDGSTDRTFEKAERFANKGLIKLVHREEASGKKARAINHGLLFSTGDIIVVVDADTILEKTLYSS